MRGYKAKAHIGERAKAWLPHTRGLNPVLQLCQTRSPMWAACSLFRATTGYQSVGGVIIRHDFSLSRGA